MDTKTVRGIFVVAALLTFCSTFGDRAVAEPVSQCVTVTGWISCTHCLMPNTCKAQTRLSCTESWIGRGASYVLVVGDRHYVLSGFEKELARAAAENSVTVSGDLSGTDLVVTTVDLAHKVK